MLRTKSRWLSARAAATASRRDYLATLEAGWRRHLEPKPPEAPTVVSIFAGAGGSSLGYSMAGYRERLAVEWGRRAAATFRLNFPGVPLYEGDVAGLTGERALELAGGLAPGDLDVLDGSPPCQGFSVIGRRQFRDPRNELFGHFCRLLAAFRPRALVMENVWGMVKGPMKLVFARALAGLRAQGYHVRCRLLDAQYFGVPQRRKRLIFIGFRADLGLEPSHPAAQTLPPFTIEEAIGDLPAREQRPEIDHVWVEEAAIGTRTYRALEARAIRAGQKVVPNKPSSTRGWWDRVAPTLHCAAPGGRRPYLRHTPLVHPGELRSLSIRELARCSGFPDQFRLADPLYGGTDHFGNAVPPPMMRAIAEHVRGALGK